MSLSKARKRMKSLLSKIIFIVFDSMMIALSIFLSYLLRNHFTGLETHTIALVHYLSFLPLFIIPILLFAYEGIYTYRYDFWHDSRLVLKGLSLSLILIFAYLAMTKSVESYSRLVIGFSFLFMSILIPFSKNMSKKWLYKIGIWQKKAKIYGNDAFLTDEIYANPYLGYIKPEADEKVATVFINSKDTDADTLKTIIDSQIKTKHEVIFIPLMNEYDLTHSPIYELSNTRTNLIVFKNRLKSHYRRLLQHVFNYLLALLMLPVLLPIIGILAFLIKKESSGSIFFTHNRMGQNGKIIPTLKFRSMYSDAQERLNTLLKDDEAVRNEWETNFKLKDDPRVTRIGAFLRKTSLDELPQIFNVLKGEMNFVGPRPVIQREIDQYYKENAEYYFMVKPGITGLWQVSGRSDTDYDFRVATDKWYVTNWSLWLDIVILIKTIKVVLKQDGAY
jgi:undecaprenyl-phosphate galactose phosphotransferase